MSLRLLAIVLLLGACAELVSQDDPRRADGFEEPGTCDGFAVSCEDRAQSQCNSGCKVQSVCHSIASERCPAYREANACDADYQCSWSLGTCEVAVGVACPAYESQTACSQAPLHECVWGPACTGSAAFCFDAESSVACNAMPGCDWQPNE
jgi:hypothetical protein